MRLKKHIKMNEILLSHGFNVFDEGWALRGCNSKNVWICRPDDSSRVPEYNRRQACTSILLIFCKRKVVQLFGTKGMLHTWEFAKIMPYHSFEREGGGGNNGCSPEGMHKEDSFPRTIPILKTHCSFKPWIMTNLTPEISRQTSKSQFLRWAGL